MSHRHSSQNRMRYVFLCASLIACLAACDSGEKSNGPGEPQSPGGFWGDPDAGGGLVSFLIAENGDLQAQLRLDGAFLTSLGAGTVSVTQNNVLSGSFELAGDISPLPNQQGEDLGCSVSGTVLERQTLSVDVTCADSNGVVYDETLAMMYDGSIYRRQLHGPNSTRHKLPQHYGRWHDNGQLSQFWCTVPCEWNCSYH